MRVKNLERGRKSKEYWRGGLEVRVCQKDWNFKDHEQDGETESECNC